MSARLLAGFHGARVHFWRVHRDRDRCANFGDESDRARRELEFSQTRFAFRGDADIELPCLRSVQQLARSPWQSLDRRDELANLLVDRLVPATSMKGDEISTPIALLAVPHNATTECLGKRCQTPSGDHIEIDDEKARSFFLLPAATFTNHH